MVIERNVNTQPAITRGFATTPAVLSSPDGLSARAGSTRNYASEALGNATMLCSAPAPQAGPNPLSAIPTSWFPQGTQTRPYGGYLGPVAIPRTSGRATVTRNNDSITLTSPHGNFSMTRDPNNPGRVIVDTPQGQYSGTIRTGRNGEVIFDAGNNRTVTMRRVPGGTFSSPYIEVNASGFGLPAGHLRVFNP